ncbi:hypothetical protein OBBRIDRAFT_526055 [Obba rivulosa]|uniref:Uncharacterized protein n=1 Tax=Obba rivulosa TaxID=1052685 RepID=A0A8E2AUZ3_9APHY|nr:hypothetical protein OBBRIDRAFT_526055 [Obba rivulosa]
MLRALGYRRVWRTFSEVASLQVEHPVQLCPTAIQHHSSKWTTRDPGSCSRSDVQDGAHRRQQSPYNHRNYSFRLHAIKNHRIRPWTYSTKYEVIQTSIRSCTWYGVCPKMAGGNVCKITSGYLPPQLLHELLPQTPHLKRRGKPIDKSTAAADSGRTISYSATVATTLRHSHFYDLTS